MGIFTQKEIIIMIVVVSVLLIAITILTIMDIKEYLKNKNNSSNIIQKENSVLEQKEKIVQTENKEIEPPLKEKENVEVLEVDNTNINKEVKEEPFIEEYTDDEPLIMEVEDTPLSIQVNEPKMDNININSELEKALQEVPSEDEIISKYEEEQEKTAIISLDELMQKSNELYDSNEYVQYDDGNEPITIDEVMKRFSEKEVPVPQMVNDIVKEKVTPYSKKETFPFISSVYGMERNNSVEFENTANFQKLDRANNKEFITKLREARENK